MKTFFAKSVVACAVAVASVFSASAGAATFNDFTVTAPFPIAPNGTKTFVADKMIGNYTEVITFNTNGTFDVSLRWTAGSFIANDGNTTYTAFDTGLSFFYGVYAMYTASGVVAVDGAGNTTFTFTPNTGSLNLFLDGQNNTTVTTAPTSGTGSFTLASTGDDVLLASGNPLYGDGTLNTSNQTCAQPGSGPTSGINCGSFGSTTSFALTTAGSGFFVAPTPFYNLSFQSGQLNSFTPSGTQTINGSLDVVFANAPAEVPEPASAALLGLGLLGLGLARRRKQA